MKYARGHHNHNTRRVGGAAVAVGTVPPGLLAYVSEIAAAALGLRSRWSDRDPLLPVHGLDPLQIPLGPIGLPHTSS